MWHDIFEIIEGLISVGTYIRGGALTWDFTVHRYSPHCLQ